MAKNMQASQSYALYRKNLGDSVISMIVDGTETFSFDILSKNITVDEAEELLTAAGLPPTPIMPVNAYLVQNGQRNILIDAGDANCMGSGGRLHAILAAARIAPCSIDTVLLTHAHPDHIGGLIAQDGSPLFPNAELVLHSEELDFWGNLENFHKFPHLLGVHTLACRTFQAYRSAIHPTTGGPVAPGITLRHLPGHTPGHSGYFIESAGEGVLIWGDIVHWPDIQIPRPEVTLAFDIDPGLMIETRKGLLREIVSENLLVGGMHLNLPGFIRLSKHRDSYEIHEDS